MGVGVSAHLHHSIASETPGDPTLSPSQYLTILSFPTDQKRWLPGSKATCMTLSSCANRDRWQSPKSRPQILTFLSAEQVTISFESDEMSSARTGSCRVMLRRQ